jgi:eukaryotic-like serine/threonine-protein kinase
MVRVSKNRSVYLALAAMLLLIPSAFAQNWPMFGFAPSGGRYNTAETKIGVSNVSSLSPIWTFSAGDTPAVVVNGITYVGSSSGNVFAINVTTGAELWSFYTGALIFASPAVANGVVYVVGNGGTVCALNATSGSELWHHSLGGNTSQLAPPTVANGIVYVAAGAALYALNATTGTELWSVSGAGNLGALAPAVANGVVYSGDGTVYALNAASGAELWSFKLTSGGTTGLAVANGMIYLAANPPTCCSGLQPFVYALNANTGAKVWSVSGNAPGFDAEGSPAVANGVVYINTLSTTGLYALNSSTGAVLWTSGTSSESSPAIANGVLYLGLPGTSQSSVVAMNASTGAKLWTFTWASGVGGNSPTVANGVLYAGSLTAFAP